VAPHKQKTARREPGGKDTSRKWPHRASGGHSYQLGAGRSVPADATVGQRRGGEPRAA